MVHFRLPDVHWGMKLGERMIMMVRKKRKRRKKRKGRRRGGTSWFPATGHALLSYCRPFHETHEAVLVLFSILT